MKKKLFFTLALGLLIAQPALAATVTWTDWTSATAGHPGSAIGNIGGIGVKYTGDLSFAQLGSGTNYWTQGSPAAYTGSIVSNAPTASELLATNLAGLRTITFSKAVQNPLLAILSLGRASLPVSYDFNAPFTVLSEGRGYFGNGSYTTSAGDVLTGYEMHGVVQFNGTFDSISWTSSPGENWHGITVGLLPQTQPVPVPATFLLMGSGLAWLTGRRKKCGK